MPFTYKRILLIGATSGIGQALAERFIQEGSFVIVVGRRKESLKAFVEKHGHDKAAAVPFDITELDKIPHFVTNITSTYPDLDCIFLNSGIQRSLDFSSPQTLDFTLFQQELLVNYTSFISLTHSFLPFLLQSPNPTSLIYTTSNLAIVPMVRTPGYSASKAALHAFILCLRAQLKDTKIKVLELLPPAVQTELHDGKNQPDLEGKPAFGMPLDQFTEEAYKGLSEGVETHIVGGMMKNIREVEEKRQEDFWRMFEMTRKKD